MAANEITNPNDHNCNLILDICDEIGTMVDAKSCSIPSKAGFVGLQCVSSSFVFLHCQHGEYINFGAKFKSSPHIAEL